MYREWRVWKNARLKKNEGAPKRREKGGRGLSTLSFAEKRTKDGVKFTNARAQTTLR